MNALKKAARFIRNSVELYIPIVAFIVLFAVFCFQVFMRYVFKNPQSWTLEIEQVCFLWLVLLGACYAQRERGHVTFTLLYDLLGVKGKALTAMLGNILILLTFLAALLPSFHYVMGLIARAQVTSILKISKTLVFFPYVIFLAIIAIYAALDIFDEVMVLCGKEAYIKKMLNEDKSEAELAIEAANAMDPINLNPDLSGKDEKEAQP